MYCYSSDAKTLASVMNKSVKRPMDTALTYYSHFVIDHVLTLTFRAESRTSETIFLPFTNFRNRNPYCSERGTHPGMDIGNFAILNGPILSCLLSLLQLVTISGQSKYTTDTVCVCSIYLYLLNTCGQIASLHTVSLVLVYLMILQWASEKK